MADAPPPLIVVLGSAGDDSNITAALGNSEFEHACIGYKDADNEYDLTREALQLLQRAEGLCPGGSEVVSAELLDLAPNVRVVTANAVGYQGIDLAACAARGVWAANTPVYELRDATADSALMLLLAITRRAKASLQLSLREGEAGWSYLKMRSILGNSPTGKTCVLLLLVLQLLLLTLSPAGSASWAWAASGRCWPGRRAQLCS